ncbi:MAG: hypothetical protein OEW62_01970 [Candidatus Bathyarchaeota archaeon]|nr:hypothetical protein [Candidatus Bathyarchaeota archaeon]
MKKLIGVAFLALSVLLVTMPVEANTVTVSIDIKPGSCPNSINLKSKGVIPVAILTDGSFDATTVDPTSVLFAGAAPLRWTIEDVETGSNNGPPDGDLDLLLFFKTQECKYDSVDNPDGMSPGDTFAPLTGETFGGTPIFGYGSVNIVPK